jgi:polyribonucleotide nucleotidyltransferase
MGQQIPITTSFQLPDGREVTIETGKLAAQADGSVVVRVGKTMLFATVVSSKDIREGQDFFPLSVDTRKSLLRQGGSPETFFAAKPNSPIMRYSSPASWTALSGPCSQTGT